MSRERPPKILPYGAIAAGSMAVGYLVQRPKIIKTRQAAENARVEAMRSRAEVDAANEAVVLARADTEKAMRLAGLDPLTELPNRRAFETTYRKLPSIVRSGRRSRQETAERDSLLMIDIDRFKAINDTRGHNEGDRVLRAVSSAIKTGIRESDVAARWGGEEIVVALPLTNEVEAAKAAEKLRISIKAGNLVTVSIGVAEVDPNLTYESNIERADKAMYAAKEGGRDQFITYSSFTQHAASN